MLKIRTSLIPTLKCSEHSFFGSQPCPWPGCANGIELNEFEQDLMVEGMPGTVWRRSEWHSPLGGTYYTWKDDLPHWFGVQNAYSNEARRLKLAPESYPDTVYHYTSLEGLVGIMTNRSVWMTEFAYLNDRREIRYGADMVTAKIDQMLNQTTDQEVRELLVNWKDKLKGSIFRIYLTSFSGEDDSLSQWRAYGPIAIGLPARDLALHVNQSRLQPVEYNPTTQQKLVDVYLAHLIAAYKADKEAGALERLPDVYHGLDRLVELLAFFKDPAFHSENEYRLAYVDLPEVLKGLGLERPKRLFRAVRGRLIPYVPSTAVLPSEHRDFPLEFSEVVLGPECDELLEQGIKEFLSDQGLDHVVVRRSLVPLRP